MSMKAAKLEFLTSMLWNDAASLLGEERRLSTADGGPLAYSGATLLLSDR